MVARYDPFRCIFLLPIFMFKTVCTKTQHHSNSVKIHLSHYYIDHFVTVSGYNLDRFTVLWTYQGWGYGAGILAQASTTSPWIRLSPQNLLSNWIRHQSHISSRAWAIGSGVLAQAKTMDPYIYPV